jgi:acyl-CoA dehydrogenase
MNAILKPNPHLIAVMRAIAANIAAQHAPDVDARARFPSETVEGLRAAGLLSAGVPTEYGGAGASLSELAAMCSTLAQGCGSSAMVLAMHHIQVACIARHGRESNFFRRFMRDNLVGRQELLGSITSEVGTFGDTRSSICAVERSNGRFSLTKDATTASYAQAADALLVTCRRAPDAANSDQVLVLARKSDYALEQTTTWDTLGMRGTVSPGFRFVASGPEEQVLPGSFADSWAESMVPYSHILWSSLWWGIAADAVARASAFVRGEARKRPGTVPTGAVRLAEVSAQLQAMRHNWSSLAAEFDALGQTPSGREQLKTIGWALKMNNLKMAASDAAPQIVHKALQIAGLMGYKNDSPFSLGRHYRDVLSASLMIANERVAANSASMLLVFKDE